MLSTPWFRFKRPLSCTAALFPASYFSSSTQVKYVFDIVSNMHYISNMAASIPQLKIISKCLSQRVKEEFICYSLLYFCSTAQILLYTLYMITSANSPNWHVACFFLRSFIIGSLSLGWGKLIWTHPVVWKAHWRSFNLARHIPWWHVTYLRGVAMLMLV